jgi:hypothetical protein
MKCNNIAHYFAENCYVCDCHKKTRAIDSVDECGFDRWTDCGKHGAIKGVHCPKCETAKLVGINN